MAKRTEVHGNGVVLLLTLLLTAMAPAGALAELPPVNATLGVRGGDATMEGYVDLIGPVWAPANGVLFLNPRGSLRDEGENEVNLGLGYRHLFPSPDIVLGVNGYFDSRESKYGNRFNQLGAGIEFLSKWVDARANYYLPEDKEEVAKGYWQEEVDIDSLTKVKSKTKVSWKNIRPTGHRILGDGTFKTTTTRTTTVTTTTTRRLFEQFEAGLEGWDAEVGGRLPIPDTWPEMRLFAGYYDFEGAFGEGTEGFKGRFEMRTGPYLTFDAEIFEDKELNGTDYFVGVRLQIPFTGMNPFSDMNKLFAPVVRTQRERLSREMVMRDVRIQMEESNFMEDPAKKTVDVDIKVSKDKTVDKEKKKSVVLAKNITVIDGNDPGGPEAGTFENPFNQIQEGVNGAGINRTIFVKGTTAAYNETVTLNNNQYLTSSIPLSQGAGVYKSKTIPTINGGGGNAVTLANNNKVQRLNLTGSRGIYGNGIRNATIKDVRIRNTDLEGIYIENGTGKFRITHSLIDGTGDEGIQLIFRDNQTASILIEHSSIINTNFDPIDIDLWNNADVKVTVTENILTAGDDGFEIDLADNSKLTMTIANNVINADSDGLTIDIDDNSRANLIFGHNVINAQSDEGMEFDISGTSFLTATIYNNQITAGTGSGSYGIEVDVDNDAFAAVSIRKNRIIAGDDAVNIDADNNSTVSTRISHNRLNGGNRGIELDISSTSRMRALINDNLIVGGNEGIDVDNNSSDTRYGLCMNISGNTVNSGAGFFDINLNNGGTIFKVQDLPRLSANNGGATVTNNGTAIQNCTECTYPPLP